MTTTPVVAHGPIVKIHSWNNSKSSHNAPKDNMKWCLKTTLIFYKNYIKKCNVTSNVAPRQQRVAAKGFMGWHLVLLGLTQWTNQVCLKTNLACPNPKTSQPGPQGKLGNQTPICQVLNFPRHHGDPNVSLTSCKLNSHKRPCHQPFATKLDFVVPTTCQQLVSWVCCCASPKKNPKLFGQSLSHDPTPIKCIAMHSKYNVW